MFARFSDPSSDRPVLMASQFYGSGRVLYVGSPELWRLRALEEELFDRFWIKAIRELGQARLKRGTNRGTLLLDRTEYLLGQTITLRLTCWILNFRTSPRKPFRSSCSGRTVGNWGSVNCDDSPIVPDSTLAVSGPASRARSGWRCRFLPRRMSG
ncbi:MAG: hypothetical protein CM1200mP2_09320 [Planctomycetaceae bacterium]|nr:MAG: hypothetical protein CM1200mP2_09320 [Planctomycetaceae bacterium]